MKTPVRLLAAIAACLTLVLVWPATALADTPVSEDWPPAPESSGLEILLFYGGGTLGLFAAIWIMGLLLSRKNYVPPSPSKDVEVSSH